MAVDNSIFPGQEDYAAWVGRKNNNGAGGMDPSQLGWGQYMNELGPGAQSADQQRIAQNAQQLGVGGVNAQGFNTWSNAPIAGNTTVQAPTMPTGTEFNDTTSPPVAALPAPQPITAPPATVPQPPIAGNTTAPVASANATTDSLAHPINQTIGSTQGSIPLGTDATQKKLAAFGGVQ